MRLRTLLVAAAAGTLVTGAASLPAHADWAPAPTAAGTVSAWGTASQAAAATVPGDLSVPTIDVAATTNASAAIGADGSLRVWGAASSLVVAGAPTTVTDGRAISISQGSGLLLRADGSVTAWGATTEISQVPDGLRAKAVSAGVNTGYAVRTDGTLAVWGAAPDVPPPAAVTALTDLVDVSASLQHFIALRANGEIVSWGNPALPGDPVNVIPDFGGKKVTQIATGQLTSGVVLEDGTIRIWPTDNALATGAPDLTGKTVTSFDLYQNAGVATDDHTVELWGPTAAVTGQEGVLTGTPVAEIAMGQSHAVALTTTFRELTKPVVTGTPRVGQALNAAPATFSLAPSEPATGQWYAGEEPIAGQQGIALTLSSAMLGKAISYRTTAIRGTETLVSSSTPTAPVGPAVVASSTVLSLTPTSAPAGQTRTVTATVGVPTNGTTPTGTVTFSIAGQTGSAALADGKATWTLPSLPVGSHTLTAAYAGDNTTEPSTSAPATVVVTKAASAVTAKAKVSGKSKKGAKKVVLTVTVKSATSAAPAGKVTVKVKGKTKKTVPVTVGANGKAKVTLKNLKRGKYTVVLTYAGNADVAASKGKAFFKA